MFCRNCGNELISGDNFCRKCGAKIVIISNIHEACTRTVSTPISCKQSKQNDPCQVDSDKKQKRRINKGLVIIFILVLICSGLFGYVIFKDGFGIFNGYGADTVQELPNTISLKDLVLVDSERYDYKSESFTDEFGYSYEGNYCFNPYTSKFPAYAVYEIDENYKSFNCSIVSESTDYTYDESIDKKAVVTIEFIVDEKVVKTISNYSFGKIDVVIDVSNATKLEIKMSTGKSMNGKVNLVNAVVSKNIANDVKWSSSY